MFVSCFYFLYSISGPSRVLNVRCFVVWWLFNCFLICFLLLLVSWSFTWIDLYFRRVFFSFFFWWFSIVCIQSNLSSEMWCANSIYILKPKIFFLENIVYIFVFVVINRRYQAYNVIQLFNFLAIKCAPFFFISTIFHFISFHFYNLEIIYFTHFLGRFISVFKRS